MPHSRRTPSPQPEFDASSTLRFGRYALAPLKRELLADGLPLAIGGRAFDLLHLLARQSGRPLTAEQLQRAVWPDRQVGTNNLRVQIAALRELLGKDAVANDKLRGYSLALPVHDGTEDSAPAAALSGNLPAHLPEMHGREADRQQLDALLAGHTRVTLAGPAGVGKTTLARACAHDARARHADGAWWVDLAALDRPALLATTVAAALHIVLRGSEPLAELARALAARRLLLVLDNCEHLLDAVCELADSLLTASPGVALLATSRRPLRCAGEQLMRLGTLSLPEAPGLAAARHSGAVAWFVARAERADPGFALTESNADTVVHICRQLDGLALAIGLAAARVPLLGLAGLHERLHERLRLLVGREADARGQPQALLAALDWSHGLLGVNEQTVLRRLGVFAGSFALQAVQAVAVDDDLDEWAVLEALGALIEHSMLMPDAAALQRGDTPARYTLHESLRLYAQARLAASGEAPALQRRHATHLLGGGRPPDVMALSLDDADHDNLRAALAWASEHDIVLAMQLLLRHNAYMRKRGHHLEAQRVASILLAHPLSAQHPQLSGQVHLALVAIVFERGDVALAHQHTRLAQALLEPLGDLAQTAEALSWAGMLYLFERELDAAEAALARAAALQRAAGVKFRLVDSLNNIGCLMTERGRFAQARQALDESLALSRGLRFTWGEAISLENLGELAYAQRDWSAAMACWLQAMPLMRELAHLYHQATLLLFQGLALRRQGQRAAALAHTQASLRMSLEQQLHALVADALNALASLALDEGLAQRAAVLLRVAARERRDTVPIGPTLMDLSETEAAVRAALGAADWHAACAEGDGLTAGQVAAQALGMATPPARRSAAAER